MEGQNSKDTHDKPEEVVSPVDGGQDLPPKKVPEKKLDNTKKDEEKEKTGKTTPGLDNDKRKEGKNKDEYDKINKPIKKGKRERSPNKEPTLQPSPLRKRKRGRKPKLSMKSPVVPALPTFRTTRNLNAVKYVNRVTRKQIPNDIHKRNRVCIDCKNTEVEECLLCGKEQHVCDMGVEMKIQADYVWLWVCLDCLDIATNDIAMQN